jgi:protein-S-isoprenylcysteine O-methyltransferase Ste14
MERVFVWAGGGAFVGSLALTLWLYAVRFADARAASGSKATAIVLDTLLFGLFALHHSLFAREWAKHLVARVVPDRLIRSVYVWVASLCLAAMCFAWVPVGGEFYRLTGWVSWLCAGVQLLGVWMTYYAVSAINALDLAGIRSGKPEPVSLQVRGVYGVVRHPVYTGWVLMVFGTAHMTGDRLLFAVITSAYLVLAVPWEERSLVREFGPGYRNYQARVRWRIVPFIY